MEIKLTKKSGSIAYITRKESDNGLDGFIENQDKFLNIDYPVITIGNETAQPFVQKYPFYTGTKVNILKPKHKKNSNCHLYFIATSLNQHKNKYSYSYTINSTRLAKQIIKLPVDKEGQLDYKYMKEYIQIQEIKEQYKIIEFYKKNIASY